MRLPPSVALVRAAVRPYLPVLVGAAILLPHALAFSFLTDDGYISFRYARNLALHGELAFNLGERVEGYTNFLWTVLLAGAFKLGVIPEIAAKFLGVFFGVAGLAAVTRISLVLDGERPRPAHFVAPALLGASSAYACWCTGGLETQLFSFLVLAATARLFAGKTGAGALFALAAMTRPEGTLFFALAVAYRIGHAIVSERRFRPRPSAIFFVVEFAALFAPYFLWRALHYGWLFPNTFYVKSSGGGRAALEMGLYYLRRFAEDHALVFGVPFIVAGAWLDRVPLSRSFFIYAALVAIVFSAYVAKVGGDFMGLYRFILPLVPLGALLVQQAARVFFVRLRPLVGTPTLGLTGALLGAGLVVASAHTSRAAITFIGADRGIDTPGYLKSYVEERIPIGRWFARYAQLDDLMTVGGAGVIPYYSGIRAHDVFGLVDEKIAHDPAMTVSARPGHQKWGSDAYLVSRRPTLITHQYSLHAPMAPNPEYWRALGYEWVTAEIPGLAPPPTYTFLKRIDRAFGPFPAH